MDELVAGRFRVRDGPRMGDEENLPVFLFFNVAYSLFYAGTVVQEKARRFEVLVGGHQFVTLLGGVGFYGSPLLFAGGEFAPGIGPYVRSCPRHVGAMIACGASGIILAQAVRRDVAQSGSALGWGPSGRRFKSGRPDSFRKVAERIGHTKSIVGHRRLYGPHRDLLFRRLRAAGLYLGPARRRPLEKRRNDIQRGLRKTLTD